MQCQAMTRWMQRFGEAATGEGQSRGE